MDKSTLLNYYKKKEIAEALVREARGKEVGMCFGGKGFGKRPDILEYPGDVLELVGKGVTSFHVSEETWENPLALGTEMKLKDLNLLRKGWDLVIDIDCKVFEYSKLAAHYILEALKYKGVKSTGCKFSGNKGFHIGVPFEAFPKEFKGKRLGELFPEAPRLIAKYIGFLIERPLGKAILDFEKGNISRIEEKTGFDNVVKVVGEEKILDVGKIIEVDTLLISSRHLYRMAYSFNEKSGLVSVPLSCPVLEFEKRMAKPENVRAGKPFLDRQCGVSATALLEGAYEYERQNAKVKEKIESKAFFRKARDEETLGACEKIKEGLKEEVSKVFDYPIFPPCIKKILLGMEDGKKRALFVLMNFFGFFGLEAEELSKIVEEWNSRNKEPLRENYIVSQLKSYARNKERIMPPNCENPVYKDIGICSPDNLCRRIKNPFSYALRRFGKK